MAGGPTGGGMGQQASGNQSILGFGKMYDQYMDAAQGYNPLVKGGPSDVAAVDNARFGMALSAYQNGQSPEQFAGASGGAPLRQPTFGQPMHSGGGAPGGGGQAGQPGGANPYQQAAGAYGDALSSTDRAMQMASGMPIAQANAPEMQAARDVNAGQLSNTNLDPYMNPYQQQVIDQSISDMDRGRVMQQERLDGQAMQAGAFGGSRHGVTAAETNRNYFDRLGAMTSGLRQQNFTNAQNMGLADIGNRMQGDLANQQADLSKYQTDALAKLQTNLANAQAQNTGNQNQFSNMMKGAGMYSGLAQQGFGFGQSLDAQTMQRDALSRGLQQQTIDAGRQQYQNFANQGNMGLSPLAQFTSGNYGSTTSQSNDPGLLANIGTAMQVAGTFCWVAREVYGPTNPEWLDFREWMLTKAPNWLRKAYIKHGPKWADWVKRNPWSKRVLRPVMDWLKG